MLKVCNLSKKIQGKAILNNLSFEIDHGKIGIFLGESGAGKSTLLRVLNTSKAMRAAHLSSMTSRWT